MWIFLALISICRRAHVFCFILLIPVNLQQYRGEIGASYNRSCKYTFVRYSFKFNNISCLAFYVVIFVKGLKNCTNCIIKLSIISLHLLVSYSFLTQLWIYSYRISLSGDIELNPGPKWDINQYFSVCHWNLNSVASHKFSKIQSLIASNCVHKFDIICLSESYLNSETLSGDSNLQIPGYNFARMDHLSNTNVFIASESHRRILSSRMY